MKKNGPLEFMENGKVEWVQDKLDRYVVTGVTTCNKRFSYTYQDWPSANGINLYRGSKWLLREGKRYLIQRVWN